MSLTTSAPAPGWFPDPGDPAQERWWSGEGWTEHSRRVETVAAPAHETAPAQNTTQTHADTSAQPEYVFGMTPSTDERPTLPSLEQLIAAAAEPAPAAPAPAAPAAPAPAAAEPAEPAAPAPFPIPAGLLLPESQPAALQPAAQQPTHEPAAHEPAAGFTQPSSTPPAFVQPEAAPQAASAPSPYAQPTYPQPTYAQPAATASAAPLPTMDIARPAPGFTAAADPTVADRYRTAPASPMPVPGSMPPALGSPDQPGWAGMPLPTAGAAPYGQPMAPGGYSPQVPAAAPYAYQQVGSNKAAKLALSTGLSSLAALVFIFFGRILIVPSALSLVAIVAGIVGLVVARRAMTGKGQALAGLLMGIATSAALTVSVVMTVLPIFFGPVDTTPVEEDIIANAGDYYGVEVVSATCPADITPLQMTDFSCTAVDSLGATHLIDVTIYEDGYYDWTIVD